ncbi:MAG: hypothetical protein JSV82_09180 [Planctomycetota bacterium]|nr:MAG: hypothetical protein JSV82_09180 [Planctomycetota bacterium]
MRGKLILLIPLVLAVGASVAVAVDYIVIDDFDSYTDDDALRSVWKDSLTGHTGEGVVYVCTDSNFAVDGNSMRFEYYNTSNPFHSETRRSYATG